MKFFTGLTLFGLAAATAIPASKQEEQELIKRQFTGDDCVKGVHLIALGGEYTTVGNLSYLQTLANNILAAIPNSQLYQIGYPEGAPAPVDIPSGIQQFTQHMQQYTQKCPKTKIVTIGYSVGAAILMDSYCGDAKSTDPTPMTRDYRDNLLANILYGDLTFVSTERSAQKAGTCTSGQGIVPRAKPGLCYPYGRKTKSYCDVNDPQCCDPGVGDPAIHFTYPALYDGIAADWVKAKWNYYKKHMKN